MKVAMDLDVLADDYFVRFILDFDSEDAHKKFCDKVENSSISRWLVMAHDDTTKQRIGVGDVDDCISTLHNVIQSFLDRTPSEIYQMIYTFNNDSISIITLPLDDPYPSKDEFSYASE